MPFVRALPQGNNVSMVMGLSEQTRSLEARRALLNIAPGVGALAYSPPSTSFVVPPSWPIVTACIGPSGAAWAIYQFTVSTVENAWDVGICVDGAVSAPWSGGLFPVLPWLQSNAYNTVPGNSFMGGQTGLAPGWHTFSLQVAQDPFLPGPGTVSAPTLVVWPL